jgi:hypothetical protein
LWWGVVVVSVWLVGVKFYLHHIAKNMRGAMDHIGFGDELITLAYSKNMRKLKRQLK